MIIQLQSKDNLMFLTCIKGIKHNSLYGMFTPFKQWLLLKFFMQMLHLFCIYYSLVYFCLYIPLTYFYSVYLNSNHTVEISFKFRNITEIYLDKS